MTADPLVLIAEVDRATARLLDTVRTLDDTGLAGPSLCRGWTRGHVLTHIARNADSLVNLLSWARTGVETPQYPSQDVRNADIEAGSGRPVAEQADDVAAACERFRTAADAMGAADWLARIRFGHVERPAALVAWARLREVEVHHVDLDAGYRPADWPEAFTARLLHEIVGERAVPARLIASGQTIHNGASEPVVSGSPAALAAWLTGRSAGEDLTVTPSGATLPTLGNWR